METRLLKPVGFRRRVWTIGIACMILAPTLAWPQSSSTSYVLQQSTVNVAAEVGTTTSYELASSLGQECTVGTSSSPLWVLQSGFWGFVGSGLVPVVLMVNRNESSPDNVDLEWSGNNPPYDIYQTSDCTDVFASFFATTSENDSSNVSPPAADLVCFNVLATAPGP